MAFNWFAVAVAALASFVFGAAWYGLLGKQWMAALGKTEADIKASGRPLPLLLAMTFVAQLVMATVLSGLVSLLSDRAVPTSLMVAALIWVGFVATTLVVNHGYQGSRWSLTLIDGGHWLGVLLLQGLIIGVFGW